MQKTIRDRAYRRFIGSGLAIQRHPKDRLRRENKKNKRPHSLNIKVMKFETSPLLIAAAFTMIGFALGHVTAPKMGCPMGPMHDVLIDGMHSEDVQVFAIPGGEVHLIREGENVEVNVEVTAGQEASQNTWTSGEGAIQAGKKVVVVSSDDD
tara:strand:- start:1729 stop:2184 length:456 start_codon:yes stop_codon:yes gene_type:complete